MRVVKNNPFPPERWMRTIPSQQRVKLIQWRIPKRSGHQDQVVPEGSLLLDFSIRQANKFSLLLESGWIKILAVAMESLDTCLLLRTAAQVYTHRTFATHLNLPSLASSFIILHHSRHLHSRALQCVLPKNVPYTFLPTRLCSCYAPCETPLAFSPSELLQILHQVHLFLWKPYPIQKQEHSLLCAPFGVSPIT